MRGKMIHPVERLLQSDRQCLRRCHSDEQCTRQARTGRHRNRIDVPGRDSCGFTCPLDGRRHRLKVRTRRNLGHDPAEAGVLLDAGSHGIGQQGVPAHDANAGLITRRLDPQNQRLSHRHNLSSPEAASRWPLRRRGSTAAADQSPQNPAGHKETAPDGCPRGPPTTSAACLHGAPP